MQIRIVEKKILNGLDKRSHFCIFGDMKKTDSIPRASIEQIIKGLCFLDSAGGKGTFDQVRIYLNSHSTRKSPSTKTAMWSVARDVLTELQKLGFASVGILPRKLSDVEKFSNTPCEILPKGATLAKIYTEKAGQAYDQLLLAWMNEHPYFRAFMARLLQSPLFIPDITSAKHLGELSGRERGFDELANGMVNSVELRLNAVSYPKESLQILISGIRKKIFELKTEIDSIRQDAKRIVDFLDNSVLVPSFLTAEGLPIDPVTFQHLIKCGEQFYSAAWTSSNPVFEGRTVFSTCSFLPDIVRDRESQVTEVVHRGSAFANPKFSQTLVSSYNRIIGASAGYADAYAIRALVCVELNIQPKVFAACLGKLLNNDKSNKITIYTELPFTPPPAGESYVEVENRRIGRLKLTLKKE